MSGKLVITCADFWLDYSYLKITTVNGLDMTMKGFRPVQNNINPVVYASSREWTNFQETSLDVRYRMILCDDMSKTK